MQLVARRGNPAGGLPMYDGGRQGLPMYDLRRTMRRIPALARE